MEAEKEQDSLKLLTTGTGGGWGGHGASVVFTQVPLCGIQGAETKADISTTVKPAPFHPDSSRTEGPVLPTWFETHLL